MRDTRRIRSMGAGKEDIKRICGDGLFVKLDSNDHVLEVTGDGCRITMTKNCGSVRVVGDGCRLNIGQNEGDVEYTGDGGRVCLGPKSSTDNVKYVGNGGRVTVDSKLAGTSLKNQRNAAQKSGKSQGAVAGEKMYTAENVRDKCPEPSSRKRDQNSSALVEEAENLLNEQSEKQREGHERSRKYEDGVKSERGSIIATKVVTSMNCGGPYAVKKWFVCPGTMIQSYDGDSCTKTVSRHSKPEARVK